MILQGVAQLGNEPGVPEPEVVQVSLTSIQALPDPGKDLCRIVTLDEIREFLGQGIELFHERRPPLILVHGPKVTPESLPPRLRDSPALRPLRNLSPIRSARSKSGEHEDVEQLGAGSRP
jgi:hypothetical protein